MIVSELRSILNRGFRFYAGLILCFFAFVPGWIEFHALLAAISDPKTIDLTWIIAVAVCSALCYFLLLLAYRAFTGRGRRVDGGLLPPFILQVFATLFAAVSVLAIAYGVYGAHWINVLHGLLGLFAAAAVFRLAGLRRARAERMLP